VTVVEVVRRVVEVALGADTGREVGKTCAGAGLGAAVAGRADWAPADDVVVDVTMRREAEARRGWPPAEGGGSICSAIASRLSRFFISGGRPFPLAFTCSTCVRTLWLPSGLVTVVVVVRVVLPNRLVDVFVFTSVVGFAGMMTSADLLRTILVHKRWPRRD